MDANSGSIIRHLICEQLRQFQLTGLFLASTGNFASEVQRVQAIWNLTKVSRLIAQNEFPEPEVDNIPVIYNPSDWTSDRLCGYTGKGLRIFPSGMIASKMELWLLALKNPGQCKNHFLKCALWYSETSDNPQAGISLLFDLFGTGYFAWAHIFVDTLDSFIRCYAVGADFSFMRATTLANVGAINEKLNKVLAKHRKTKLDAARFNELLGAAIDLALDRVQEAHDAVSLDDWIVCQAQVLGPAMWLSQVFPSAEKIGVAAVYHTLLSRFNELMSDLHAVVGYRETQAENELPLRWEIESTPALAGTYERRYSKDSWLDRMTEDRLVMPNVVRELVRGTSAKKLGKFQLPRTWRFPSERIILPLCIAHRRQPTLLRASGFSKRQLTSEIRKMGLGRVNDQSRVAARRRLLLEESSMIIKKALGIRTLNKAGISELAFMRSLYPWHPVLCRLMGVCDLLTGDLENAFSSLVNCVLIGPHIPPNWMALAKFAEFRGLPGDAKVLNVIAQCGE